MVDTVKELSELSRKLNQKSDTLNAVITSLNEKLAKLNLGVEAWLLDPIEAVDAYFLPEDKGKKFPRRDAILLGYCKFDGGWALATKHATLVTRQNYPDGEENEEVVSASKVAPLLTASRTIRANSMRLVPSLLDAIKMDAERLLNSIEKAEKAAEKL